MEIIAHRGYWTSRTEMNTRAAFKRSFAANFGVETDVRDLDGEIVISHDMPRVEDNPLTLDAFLDIYLASGCLKTLALNVKSDGLQAALKKSLCQVEELNYFLFDMSVPDQLLTERAGLHYLTRMSEIEPCPSLLNNSGGVWIDEFDEGWFTIDVINEVLTMQKRPFVVSPELHGRPYGRRWKELAPYAHEDFVLCTDFPQEARDFFET